MLLYLLISVVIPLAALAFTVVALLGIPFELMRWSRSRARAIFTSLLLLAVAGTATRIAYGISPLGDTALLREHTKLALPSWPSSFYYSDNADGLIVAHMILTPEQAAKLPKGELTPCLEDCPVRWAFGDPDHAFLRARLPADRTELRQTSACIDGWGFEAFLDPKYNDLWVILHYMDAQGDSTCEAPTN